MNSPSRKARPWLADASGAERICEAPDCDRSGEYKAPKSRSNLREFRWFCLAHVRAYNAAWDYYRGMSADEIESEVRADVFWQRPSWPLGHLGQNSRMEEAIHNELHAFAFGPRPKPASNPELPQDLRDALRVFELVWPVTLDIVKTRYKELAKRHHPDANPGNSGSEEVLKTINLAYATLRGKLSPAQVSPQPAAD